MSHIHTGATKVLDQIGRGMVEMGLRDSVIAQKVGCTKWLVQQWRAKRGIPAIPTFRHSRKLSEMGQELYGSGLSDRDIADRIGCTSSNIRQWRKARGLKPNCKVGDEDWYVKNVDWEVREQTIRLMDAGYTDKEAASELGIKPPSFAARRRRLGFGPNKKRNGLMQPRENDDD